jgi:uncharacterized protein (TIGR00251 family)
MKISVKTIPHAKSEEVIQQNNILIVRVKAPAKEGKANDAVIRLLSEHFHVPKSHVSIVTGHTARNKIVEIAGR